MAKTYCNSNLPNAVAGVKAFLEATFKVRRYAFDLNEPYEDCTFCASNFVEEKIGITDADLYLSIGLESDSTSNWNAAGTSTDNSPYDNRPTSGVIKINMAISGGMVTADYQETLMVLIHAVFHVLGFNQGDDGFFVDEKLDWRGKGVYFRQDDDDNRMYFYGPNAVAAAQKHFGCDSITRIPMENHEDDGNSDSHWEAT